MSEARPTLVYDGDCGICRYWVNYWQGLTHERVVYRPYQEAAVDFPAIPVEAFRRSIQLIDPDGRVYSGAAATYRVLRHARGRGAWWWLYAHVPGVAAVSERAYEFFARRRDLLNRVTTFLWGPALEPEHYDLVSWVFLRAFGAIYVAAFASLGAQILGLVGHAGILPLNDYLGAAHEALGNTAYWILPTLFWLSSSDTALIAGTTAGMVLATIVMLDWCTRPALIGLFVLYLSYVYAGQDFMRFQWDLLLLEAGFLAIFLTARSRIVVWLYRWLMFRYLFLAGAVKILSGDPTWHDWRALEFHFWSQPLPTPLAWYAAQLPHGLLVGATALTLAAELVIVFLIFLPRRLRAGAGCCIVVFQSLIMLTGNYNFFNLLSMLMCVFLFDDAALRRVVPHRLAAKVQNRARHPERTATVVATALALIVVPVGLDRIWQTFNGSSLPAVGVLTRAVSPLLIVNPYGLFAVMTTTRPEIVIEGSVDGQVWREYGFRYKPGPETRPPKWNIPHQPRLDWQMWFAALGSSREAFWFQSLMRRLLEGSPPVLELLGANPFPDRPPKYVRAQLYDYRFTDRSTHEATGQWWIRKLEGLYFPAVSLVDLGRVAGPETALPRATALGR
jgi:predicted DCC family thiol-disulfide oxidoreductase YuxK